MKLDLSDTTSIRVNDTVTYFFNCKGCDYRLELFTYYNKNEWVGETQCICGLAYEVYVRVCCDILIKA